MNLPIHPSPWRVLLVDDCPMQQLRARALLSRWGVMPQIARDGLKAVLRVGEQDFDIVLMEVEMPAMDGLKATARIRQNERRARRAPFKGRQRRFDPSPPNTMSTRPTCDRPGRIR